MADTGSFELECRVTGIRAMPETNGRWALVRVYVAGSGMGHEFEIPVTREFRDGLRLHCHFRTRVG